MRRALGWVGTASIALLAFTSSANAQAEFVGPFPSWGNVRSFGALGDGKADDTRAIQKALDALAPGKPFAVLYFPAGVYRVTSTLTLKYREGLSMIGEDPENTTLLWDGSPEGILMHLNGIAYSKFDRFTFDGGGKAGILVDQSGDGKSTCCFDTGNEYADDRFVGAPAGIGIRGGNFGTGFAETTILRDRFLSLRYGVSMKNFNALDMWVWDSLFDHCETALTNDPGAGNWHVYNSVFRESREADNKIGNTGGFSFIGNYSTGSAYFLTAGGTANPAYMTLQANVIVNRGATPIATGNQGPLVLIDNRIVATASKDAPVAARQWTGADAISIGNRFQTRQTIQVEGRLVTLDDKGGVAGTMPREPMLPGTAPTLKRKIFEVAPGSSAAQIQSIVNAAASSGEKRAVVHFPAGTYEASFVVPAGDLQIVGDGYFASWIEGSVRLLGPSSHVWLRDLRVRGKSAGDGVTIESSNGKGRRVALRGVLARGSGVNIYYDRSLSGVELDARDIGHADARRSSVVLEGDGVMNFYSGSGGDQSEGYLATKGKLLIRDTWHETNMGGYLRASGDATVTVAGSHAFTAAKGATSFDLRDFNGVATVLATEVWGTIGSVGQGRGMIAGLGILGSNRDFFKSRAPGGLMNSRTFEKPPPNMGTAPVPDEGNCGTGCIRKALKHLRESVPGPIRDLPADRTDIRLDRVWIQGFDVGLHLTGSSASVAQSSGKR